MGLGLAAISFIAVPISIAWLVNALWIGRRNEQMAGAIAAGRGNAVTGAEAVGR
jgi:AAA family ATP:ADP antiporter